MRPKTFQAKHITDESILKVVAFLVAVEARRNLAHAAYCTASRWDIIEAFQPIPWKIVNAKLTSMVRRGLIDGCAGCTCRGSFIVKEKKDDEDRRV